MTITPRTTQFFLSVVTCVVLVYAWLALVYGEPGSRISEVIWDLCDRYKLVLVLVLLLVWHLILGEAPRGE